MQQMIAFALLRVAGELAAAESQITNAGTGDVRHETAQGIANALLEEIVYDGDGNILTGSFADFPMPTMAEIPHIEIDHLATETDASITKAKGLGEGGAIGAPAAVLNAIADALQSLGIEPLEMPMTPVRLHELIIRARKRGTT